MNFNFCFIEVYFSIKSFLNDGNLWMIFFELKLYIVYLDKNRILESLSNVGYFKNKGRNSCSEIFFWFFFGGY